MANWPPVDPTDLEDATTEDLINRATGFNYEPGSTFKAFTVSAALEEKLVTPETDFTLPPTIHVADRTIEDAEAAATENMTVAQILAHSSNVGAVTIGLEVGAEKFSKWIDRFGFGRPTGVQFPGEEQGIVTAARRILGLDDGQPADRPGALGDADADGRRLHGDRQRRHPQTAAADREGRRRNGPRAEGPPGDQGRSRRADPDDARGRARARAAPPRRSASPATPWPARPAPPRSPKTAPTRKPNSSPPSSASPRPRTRSCWSR